jgi:ATP-dependent Clp protease adaptor protein ClpS
MNPFPQIENDQDVLEKEITTAAHDVNTFEFVINVLIEVCGHDPLQAEQCTLLIHYKGKCSVKQGGWDKLVAMRNSICDRGLSAEVE